VKTLSCSSKIFKACALLALLSGGFCTAGAVTIGDGVTVNASSSGVSSLDEIVFQGSQTGPVTAVFHVDTDYAISSRGAADWEVLELWGTVGRIETAPGVTLTLNGDFIVEGDSYVELSGKFVVDASGAIGGIGYAFSVGPWEEGMQVYLGPNTTVNGDYRGLKLYNNSTLIMDGSSQFVLTDTDKNYTGIDLGSSTIKLTGVAQAGHIYIDAPDMGVGTSDGSATHIVVDLSELDIMNLSAGDLIVLFNSAEVLSYGTQLTDENFTIINPDGTEFVIQWGGENDTILQLVMVPEPALAAWGLGLLTLATAIRRKGR